MILICHLLAGAAIATKVRNPFLGLPLAFLSHYVLDFIPHEEYEISPKRSIDGKIKNWTPLFLKIGADFLIGVLILLIISKNKILALSGGFLGILGDFDNVVSLFPSLRKIKFLSSHTNFHAKYLYYFANKKIPLWVKILSQVFVILITIYFLR